MRYYKGLGIGHIYIRLKADDALLVNGGTSETQNIPIPSYNSLDLESPPTTDDGWTMERTGSDSSDEDDLVWVDDVDDDDVADDAASDRNSIQDDDSLDEGSDDILDLDYYDMFGDQPCESDYED